MAEVLDRVGAALRHKHGDDPIPSDEIVAEVEQIRGQNPGDGCPADACYNLWKKGNTFSPPMFLFLARGKYLYVGREFKYTGPVLHFPKGEAPRQVGYCIDGRYFPLK
ncbi:MAG: hypothetical protein U0871_25205 [Gemmataceae bacterium]